MWHPAPFRDGGRPYVVLSDDAHPFHGEEYLVVGVTTTERERAVALPPDAWADGGAPEPSWASPWYVLTVKHMTVTDRLGRLTSETTDEIAPRSVDWSACIGRKTPTDEAPRSSSFRSTAHRGELLVPAEATEPIPDARTRSRGYDA